MARVLAIDDEENVLFTIRCILARSTHEVQCTMRGAEGVRLFRETSPQLVITDIIMPEQDGLATINEIRRASATAKIIAISGGGRLGNTDMLAMARRMGADHVLEKPFSAADLLGLVEHALQAP
jgi:DNA-binding response OmpR family regulator